ncbi:MAG: hypothetical protein KDD61_14520 [Bdellovibrionales bacterium]|nr:hypothetical protein [Bdellovibrionales bacterium]
MIIFSIVSNPVIADIAPMNTPQCLFQIPKGYQGFSNEVVQLQINSKTFRLDVGSNVETLVSRLREWTVTFDIAQDSVFNSSSSTLCLGAYNDEDGANAKAFRPGNYILFGLRLMTEISSNWKVDYSLGMDTILAHEFAHILQFRHGFSYPYTLPMLSVKIQELQADCIAGLILSLNHPLDLDQRNEALRLLSILGDQHAVGDHGLAEQRKLAFYLGEFYGRTLLKRNPLKRHLTSTQMFGVCSQRNIIQYTRR